MSEHNNIPTANILSYGGGINSTAMLVGLRDNKIPLDLILFADTGAEQPETYEYIKSVMDPWLKANGYPQITTVYCTTANGERMTLEQECLKSHTLPSIAYGFKKCSLKHKVGPQDKFCNNNPLCIEVWKNGGKVNKYIGYDAGEENRRTHAVAYDIVDKKYRTLYPLIDSWNWGRDECIGVIEKEGLPIPGKSSCFFCPSMKKYEIRQLYGKHRDLFARAIAIEDNAQEHLISIKGLGRSWAWKDFVEADKAQGAMCEVFTDIDIPCGCYDG